MQVKELIASRLPNSLLLAGITALVSVPLALLLGILCALYRGSWFDRATTVGAVAVVSVPEFLVATLAVLIFAVHLRWLPALSASPDTSSFGVMIKSFAMPVLSLACVIIAQMMRMTRAAVIDQLGAAYIEMVRLKGATPARMVLAHALPNAVGPIANAVALSLSYLLGRRHHRRGDLQLSGDRQADGRRGRAARHAAGPGVRDDLLRGVPDPRHAGRHRRHLRQSAVAASVTRRSK
jgi:peptide/nickel transport system permease protein